MSDNNQNTGKFDEIFEKYNSLKKEELLDENTHQRIKSHALNTLERVREERDRERSKGFWMNLKNTSSDFFSVNRGLKVGIIATAATCLIVIGIFYYYPQDADEVAKPVTDIADIPPKSVFEIYKPEEKFKPIKQISFREQLAALEIEKRKKQGFGISAADESDLILIIKKIDELNSYLAIPLEFKAKNEEDYSSEPFLLNRNDSLFGSTINLKFKSKTENKIMILFYLNCEYPSKKEYKKKLIYNDVVEAMEKLLYNN
jgi:hypothetical protein